MSDDKCEAAFRKAYDYEPHVGTHISERSVIYNAFVRGRSSRDAEVERLQKENAALKRAVQRLDKR